MVRWGVVWGVVLGLFWPGHETEWHCVVGAILGALSGLMLRSAVQQELRKASQALVAPAVPVPTAAPPVPTPAGPLTRSADFQSTVPASLAPEPVPPSPTTIDVPLPATSRPSRDPVTIAVTAARDWLLGGNTIVRLGLLVLFVGLAFLAKYAVDNALLPPQLRLAAVAAAGIGLFVGGWRLRGRAGKRGYALSLQGAGVAVLYLTVFASFRLYQFLPAGAAFAVLALVCAFSAVIAVAQNSQAMAVIGFAGGYAAPLLVSTGQGSHVALFTYYLVLGTAITAIAWSRAWRPLNLLGFLATFGVATAWGVLRYLPAQFASTEPFLVAFFLLYVAAAVLYATRHQLAPNRAVDGTLVFGVPMACTALQAGLVRDMPFGGAYSALAAGAFYLLLTSRMAARAARGDQAARWLGECFIALGLGFVTLAVPLAIDPAFTAGVWAIEGVAVFWLGARQGRWVPRVAGLVLQVLAAGAFVHALPGSGAHQQFFGAVQLAVAAMLLAWWSRSGARQASAGLDRTVRRIEVALSPALFWAAFLWLQDGLWAEIGRTLVQIDGTRAPILEAAAQSHLALLAWVVTAFALHGLAAPSRASPWTVARTPALTVLPVLFIGAIWEAGNFTHVFTAGGWMVWPLLLVLHGLMLRRLDVAGSPAWWSLVHAAGV